MFPNPPHVHPVAAVGKDVANLLVGIEELALLVDHHSVQGLGAANSPFVRLNLPRQKLEQGGLARPIGAHHPDPVSPRDAEGEIHDDGALAESLHHLLGVDHHLGFHVVIFEAELCSPGRAEHRSARGPHLMELCKPPLVALPSGRNAPLQPVKLQLELGVQPLGVARFLGIDLLGPRIEATETDLGPPQATAFQPEAGTGEALQEGAVVADRDEGAGVAGQPILKPFDRRKVEMVGRLVEQQDLRILRKRAGDRCSAALPARSGRARTVEIDPDLAEAYMSLGLVKFYYDHDWKGAEAAYQQAIKINPGIPLIHQRYGTFLMLLSRFDEAIAEFKLCCKLDPLSVQPNVGFAVCLALMERYDEAIKQIQTTINLEPHYYPGQMSLGFIYLYKGEYQEAIEKLNNSLQIEENNNVLGYLGYTYAVSGQLEEAEKILERLKRMSKQKYISPYYSAIIYAGLGKKEKAFEYLERLFDEHSDWLVWLKLAPELKSLRSDERFVNLLKRVNLL